MTVLNVTKHKDGRLRVFKRYYNVRELVNEFLKGSEILILDHVTKEDVTYKTLGQFINMNSSPEITEALRQFIKENFIGGTKVPEITTPELRSIIQKIEDLEKDNTLVNFNRIFEKEVVGDDSEEVFILEPIGPSTRRKIKVGSRYFEINLDTHRNTRSDSANAI